MVMNEGLCCSGGERRFSPHNFVRRDPREDDVVIDILYSGVCHSDIHNAYNDWGGAKYPMVPKHEIIGRRFACW